MPLFFFFIFLDKINDRRLTSNYIHVERLCSDEVWQNVQMLKTPKLILLTDWEPQHKATPVLVFVVAFV